MYRGSYLSSRLERMRRVCGRRSLARVLTFETNPFWLGPIQVAGDPNSIEAHAGYNDQVLYFISRTLGTDRRYIWMDKIEDRELAS
jgi:hypothetical protein